ncbi:Transmembrane 9 super member 2 [Rhodotorula toruloides]
MGDRLYNSDFDLHMRRNETCKTLCTTTNSPHQTDFLQSLIRDYAHNWVVDGLPAAEMRADGAGRTLYSSGFPVGGYRTVFTPEAPDAAPREAFELYNHFQIVIEYHPRPKEGASRIVGVLVWPQSIDSLKGGRLSSPDCDATGTFAVAAGDRVRKVAYTYDVYWRESATPWATRWDSYLRIVEPRIHVLALINSIVIFCLMVGMVLLRALYRDITKYNADLDFDPADQIQDDSGWKLLHGEVFRPPKRRIWLCITVGTGAQVSAMFGSSHSSASSVPATAFVAGYVSSRLYVTMNGDAIRKNMIYTALVFPSVLLAFLHLLNFFLIGLRSAGAVPFGTFAAIGALWFGLHAPLTSVGGWIGVKRGPITNPMRVNQIPRQIPTVDWWLKPVPSALIAGILPFGTGFIEINYLMQSLFGAKAYYAFGFLALTSLVVALTMALTTVLFTYFHLCAEDYRWHWRSFVTGAASSVYVFAYGLLARASRLHLPGSSNKILFLGYLTFVAGLEAIVTETVGLYLVLPHSIQYLSLASPTEDAVPFVDIAPLFPLLTGIHSLSLNSRSLIRLYRARRHADPPKNARRDLTIEALEDLGRRIRHLSISSLPQDDLLIDITPRIASKSDLQHLSIDGNLSLFCYGETNAAATFRKYLREFSSLTSFEAEDRDWGDGELDETQPFSALWCEALSLPSVRRVKLATPAAPFVVMPAMSATSPHAERVSITFHPPDFDTSNEVRYSNEVDPVEWPRLRSFSLEGDSCIFPTVIASLAPCSQLAHLHLEHNDAVAPLSVFPERLPSNFRRVTFHDAIGLYPFALPYDECRDWCSKRGVAVDWLSWRAAPRGILPFADHHVQPSADSTTKDTLYEVLDLVTRRLDHLRSTNDEPGFEEMKQALMPLRERQYIERGRTFVDLDAKQW